MRILVTGGAGYIGSIAVELLINQGYEVSILDDLSTGHADVVPDKARFVQGSLLNSVDIAAALSECDGVLHFAGMSLVGESVNNAQLYWSVNVDGTRNLLDQMQIKNISNIVFSSSAATYGAPIVDFINETSATDPTNPYGVTKLAIDEMLREEAENGNLAATSLRYFNVAGSFKSNRGWLSERHQPETHLIPNVLKASSSNPINIFGTDWPTPDGTCIRDYVHVVDLIEAHIKALNSLVNGKHQIFNVGSGRGYSVREVIRSAGLVLGRDVPSVDSPRRAGDPAVLVADISKAKRILGWQPSRGLDLMISDALASFS